MRKLIVAVLLTLAAQLAVAQSIPLDDAAKAFAVAKDVDAQDGGKLWGMPVCGPMIFADSETHDIVANQADKEGKLTQKGNVWVGKLPNDFTPANFATEWAGVRWTMLMWPIPSEPRDRRRLLAHECFHRIQPDLKLPAKDSVNGHLDTAVGRLWLQLEWRALERALMEQGAARRDAIWDALQFRAMRRLLIKGVGDREDALMINEGLAEYTGYRLAYDNEIDLRAAAIAALHDGPFKSTFARSFAYVSGPAYGILLDESGTKWKEKLSAQSDLGSMLSMTLKMNLHYPIRFEMAKLSDAENFAPTKKYRIADLIATETDRDMKRQAQIADIKKRFIEGPVLVLPPMSKFGYGFNPNNVISLDDNTIVYPWVRVTDDWGVLEANGGMLVRENGLIKRVVVPATKDVGGRSLKGDDWKLDLAPGWKIVPGEREGDQTVKKE